MGNVDTMAPAGRPTALLPPLTASTAATSLLAGLGADLGWEVWARVVTPMLPGVGGPLEPAGLIQSVFGFQSRPAGEAIHLIVGVVFYPLGFLLIARPLQRVLLPRLPWWLTALGFGVGLFVFRVIRHGSSRGRAAILPRLGPADLRVARGSSDVRPWHRNHRQVTRSSDGGLRDILLPASERRLIPNPTFVRALEHPHSGTVHRVHRP